MATLSTSYQKLGSSWIGSAYGANYYVNLYAKYSRTDAQNTANKSTIYTKVTITCDKTSSEYSVWGTWIGTYTGQFTNSYSVVATAKGGSEIQLDERSIEVSHNNDGTYSSTLGLTNADGPLTNSGATKIDSVSIVLPTIPRYATSVQSLNSKTENAITMNWSSDSTIDYIWYSTNNGSTWKGVDVTDGTSGTYKITGLSPNTTYNIKTRVRRKDSQLTTDSTSLAVTTYKVPTNTLSSKTETKVTVNWSVDSTADYIWYSINNGSTWVAVGSVSATSGSYTISGLSPNTAYTIKTRVRRKATQTTYDTSAISVTTYKVPTNALKSKTETSITMNWSADSDVDYIWYSKDNGANWTGIDVTDGTSGSYTISGLSANTAYNVKTRIRRKATQTTYDCSTINVTTYDFPHLTSLSDFIIGDNILCSLYNPLNRTVSLKFYGNNDTLICSATRNVDGNTSVGNSQSEINEQYKSIPNSKKGTFYCNVVYGSIIKTKTGGTYSIKGTEKPIFNNFTYADTDSTITSLTGNNQILVNNNSNCKFTISTANKAVGKNSASIVKYKFEWGNKSSEANYSSSAEVTSTINDSTGNTLKVTAIDSRGLSTTVTKTITNVAYINATVDEVNIQRLNGVDVETYLGLKLSIWKGNWKNSSDTNYNNQLKYVGYRVYNGSSWTNYFDITSTVKSLMSSSSSGSTTTIIVPLSKNLAIHANGSSGGFTIGKSYTIQVLIKDGNSSATFTPSSYQATKQGTVPDGKVGFSRYKDEDGNYHYGINRMPNDNFTLAVEGNGFIGSIVVEDITCKNLADIEDVKVNGNEEINRKIYNVKPNTEYTLSYTKSRISGVTITQATIWGIRKITFYDKNGTQLSTLSGTTISLPENSSKKCLLTFTTPANTSYVECRLDNNNGDSNVNTLVSNVQLEIGSVATDYVEHKEYDNKEVYSTNEQVIGKWIDGKPLYRKTFIGTEFSNGTTVNMVTLISNVDTLCNYYGTVKSSDSVRWAIPFVDLTNKYLGRILHILNNSVRLDVDKVQTYNEYKIILEYTKTTD